MKKRKILKLTILCVMIVTLVIISIIPSFAMRDSSWITDNYPECVFCINGSGSNYSRFYDENYDRIMSNGNILIATSPKVVCANGVTFSGTGEDFYIYFYANDNEQNMTFKIYNPSTNGYYNVPPKMDIYCYMIGSRLPTILTNNLYNFDTYMYNTYGFETDWINWISIPGQYIQIVPSNRKQIIYDNITQNQYQEGYDLGYSEGLTNGRNQGFAEGQTDIVRTENILMRFISAIFTAPGHLINTIFDFEIFGFNLANLIRVLLTLAIVGLAIWIIVKVI